MFFKFFKQQREIALQNLIKETSSFLDNSLTFENDSLINKGVYEILPRLNYIERKVKKKFPDLKEDYVFLKKRFNLISEIRLYGSDLNTVIDSVKSIKGSLNYEIDWVKASNEKLPLIISKGTKPTDKLDKKSQTYLKNLWEHLFFEKSLLVTGWQKFLTDEKGNIGFFIFESLSPSSFELKNFALQYIKKQLETKTFEEKKLIDSINCLKSFCPDIDLFESWGKIYVSKEAPSQDDSYFNYISENNPDIFSKPLKGINPKDLTHLLDSSRHKKDPRFKKSSIFYWGPLLLAAYILYKYF